MCIGANTTIVTVANRLLFGAPAGVFAPDRLVDISPTISGRMFTEPLVSWPDLQEIRRRATLLEGVFGYQIELQAMSLVGPNGAERVFGTPVTSNYFSVLGVRPAAGRLLGAGDREEDGASPVVVLSHRFWTRRFDADPRVIGQTIVLTRQPFTVIGVAPEEFKGLSVLVPDVWIPSGMVRLMGESGSTRPTAEGGPAMIVGARLKPGVTIGRAAGEMDAIGRALAREQGRSAPVGMVAPPVGGSGFVEGRGEWSLRLGSWTPIPRLMRLPVAGFMTVLLALVSLVLAIACANVAGRAARARHGAPPRDRRPTRHRRRPRASHPPAPHRDSAPVLTRRGRRPAARPRHDLATGHATPVAAGAGRRVVPARFPCRRVHRRAVAGRGDRLRSRARAPRVARRRRHARSKTMPWRCRIACDCAARSWWRRWR